MITFKTQISRKGHKEQLVYLDKKKVGIIKCVENNAGHYCKWQYFSNGQKFGGDKFNTLTQCKNSLY